MTPQAIAKLRRTFIAIAMISFFVVIAFMGLATIASNVKAVTGQANRTIDAIIDADGQVPQQGNYRDGQYHEEAMYGLRYFVVRFDNQGQVIDVDVTNVKLIDLDQAAEVALVAADPNTITGLGMYEDYLYKEGATDDGSMVVFLDCSFLLSNTREVIGNTIMLSLVALLVTFISIVVFSKRAIKSEVENARRQQQFVTNAGHELKTPIAVIRANTELTEMLSGETEWTQATLRQVDRLEGLVGDLMVIARGQEQAEADTSIGEVDVSAIVSGAVDSFKGLAQKRGLQLQGDIAGNVKVQGTPGSVEQLTCLLVDNAIKYCDDAGKVHVELSSALLGRGCTLTVSNDFAEGADVDYRRFFDRFYREDESHENQQGYGIGLSVAESICERYHGSIKASWKAGVISFTCTLKRL